MTRDEIASVMAYMSAAWPSHEITDATIKVWSNHLERLNHEDAKNAAVALVENSKWFPSISEFLSAAEDQVRKRMREQKSLEAPEVAPMNENQYHEFIERCRTALKKIPDDQVPDVSQADE